MKVLIVGAKIHSGFASHQFIFVFYFIGFVQAIQDGAMEKFMLI